MRSGVLVSTIYLLSTLHSAAGFFFLRHQEKIETIYVTSRDIREDWACSLPVETKISICKELLASHFFSKILQLDYNEKYEQKGHRFDCERRPLWLVSKKHVYAKRFRGFQRMIMCPVCSKYSKMCYILNGVGGVDRQIFTRRTFDNDKKKAKMSFEEMVESRETIDFESHEYLDADDIFITNTSQQTHYTDATERFHSSQMSSSTEQLDSEQRATSGLRVFAGINPAIGRRTDASDGGNSAGYLFDAERGFDSSQRDVIPEETAADTRDVDIDQLVSANHQHAITPLNISHRVRLGPEVNANASDVEEMVDTKPPRADRLDNPGAWIGSPPNDRTLEERIAAERNIESPVRTPKENERSISEKIAYPKREILPAVRRNVDSGHRVHSAHLNDDIGQSISDQDVDLDQRNRVGQLGGTEEKADGLQNFSPERKVVAEITPDDARDTDINQRVRVSRPSNVKEWHNLEMEFEPERKLLARNTDDGSVEGSLETERGARNDPEEESDKTDKKEDLGRNEHFLEKVDAAEDPRQYANPEEELEEYYFSIDPDREQSIFLYTWFKTGGYFIIYMHVVKLQTPIPKPQIALPKEAEPFDTWTGPLHARPIMPYEPYEFVDEKEKSKLPRSVKRSNKLIEMTQFAGGD